MNKATNIVNHEDTSPELTQAQIHDLVIRIQAGDEAAFEQLYQHFYPKVHRRVWHLVPESEVDDLTQNIFLAVIRSIGSFRREARFSTWLHTLTSRQVADYYRKRERRPQQMDQPIDVLANSLPAQSDGHNPEMLEEWILLKRSMAHLPEDYQEVILLRLVDGMRFKEIAKETGKSLDAVKSLFRRAIKALQIGLNTNYVR